jgi:hypothetical protein
MTLALMNCRSMPPRTNEALPVRHGISDFLQASGAVHAARCSCYGRSPPMRAECPVPTMALSEPARLLPSPCRHSNRRTGKQTHRQTDAPARRMPGCSAGHRAPQRPGSSVRAQSLSMHLHRRCKCRAVRRLTPTALNIDARAATPRHAGEGHDFSCGTKARTYAGGSGSQAVDRARYASHSTSRGCRPAPA